MSFRQNAQHQGRATGKKVFDLTRGTAAARWTYKTGNYINSSPVISSDGSTVYVGNQDKKLHAVKTSDGTVLWTYETGGYVESSPAISSDGSTVYIGSDDYRLCGELNHISVEMMAANSTEIISLKTVSLSISDNAVLLRIVFLAL